MKSIKLTRRELLEYYITVDTQQEQSNITQIIAYIDDIGITTIRTYDLELVFTKNTEEITVYLRIEG